MDDAAVGDGGDPQAHRRRVLSRVVVLGSPGQLGSDLVAAFAAHDVVGLGHDDLELTDGAAIEATIARLAPAVVVNTAAFHNVPRCESEPAHGTATGSQPAG